MGLNLKAIEQYSTPMSSDEMVSYAAKLREDVKSNVNPPKAKRAKAPTSLRYPLSYMDDRRDYLKIGIIKFEGGKSNASWGSLGEKREQIEQSTGAGTGRYRVKLDPRLPTLKTRTESIRGGKSKTHTYIHLPIPEQLNDTPAVKYNTSQINPLQQGAIVAGKNILDGEFGAGKAWDNVQVLYNALTSGEVEWPSLSSDQKNMLNIYISGLAVKQFSNIDPNEVITRMTGNILQNNMELLANSPTLRTFSFSWSLIARDRSESKQIKSIIRAFKIGMAIRSGANSEKGNNTNFFMKSPDLFQLDFMHKGSRAHPFLNNFKVCALTGMDVNYTGNGTYSTYADGTPTHIRLTCNFSEINPIYKEDYTDSRGKQGVGY